MKKLFIVLTVSILVLIFGIGMTPFPAPLVPLDVNVDRTDDPPGYQPCTSAPNDCSLRGAISLANIDPITWETIRVPAGTYTLDLDYIVHEHEDGNVYGDLDIWGSVTIVGDDQDNTIIQTGLAYNTGIDRVFHLLNGSGRTVALSVMTIKNGMIASGVDGGGGIYQEGNGDALLTQVTVWGNRVEGTTNGGGVLVEGNMTMDDVTILENTASDSGGGVYTALNSNLTMNRSAVILNEATSGAGIYLNDDALLKNVTLYHNMGSSMSGIVQMGDTSILTMYHTTVYGNSLWDIPSIPVYGMALSYDGSVYIDNSILAANAPNYPCEDYGDIYGSSNISTGAGCGAGFTIVDPMLLPVADNGGYTQTARLLFGSPAIDTANLSYCLLEDQRGIHRPLDGDGDGTADCDIGAFESYAPAGFLPIVRRP